MTNQQKEDATRHVTRKEIRLSVRVQSLTTNSEQMKNHVKRFIHVTNQIKLAANRNVTRKVMKPCVVVMMATELSMANHRNVKKVSILEISRLCF